MKTQRRADVVKDVIQLARDLGEDDLGDQLENLLDEGTSNAGLIQPGEIIIRLMYLKPDEKPALMAELLRAIAYGECSNPRECARLVVES